MEDFDVELRGVSKSYGGRRVVDRASFGVRRGEFFSLLGPSGCGKTTLLRMIAGFDSPDEGAILLGGVDMTGVPPHRRDLNMVFQSYALFPHLDVAGNVAFGLRIQRVPDVQERVRRALRQVGLEGFERRAPSTLSGGEQQRVALARALAPGPRVLLLDEPLAALDLKLRQELRTELRRLQRELGLTFLYVTHDQEEALAMSDRVAVLNGGTVDQVGTPQEVYERPATRFTAGFVGSGNFFEGTGDGRTVRTADGLEFPCAASGEVTLLLRPEKLRLDGGPGLPAQVEEVVYQGASATLVLRAGERRLLASGPAPGIRPGQTVRVRWRPEDVWVLPR